MEENFSWFVPIDIIEKADSKKDANGLPEKLEISGVASNANTGLDKDQQLLDVNGFDYAPLLTDGYLNLEHSYAKTKDASMIVGEPTNAFVKNNKFFIEGELYKSNPKAVAMYQLAQTLKKTGSKRKIGFSIEGVPLSFDPLDNRIVKAAKITGVALTLSPKCSGTEMLVKGGIDNYETQDGSEFLIDMKDENGERLVVDKQLNILRGDAIEKAMTAGTITGTEALDAPLTQEPLKEGSIEGDKKKKKKKEVTDLTKAELYTYLIDNYKMDSESCRNFYSLVNNIQNNLN